MLWKTVSFSATAACGLVFAIAAGFSPQAHAEEPPEGMVELELDLPEPNYVGIPVDPPPRPLLPERSWEPRDPVYVPEGVENVALGRPVSASAEPTHNELADIVNGETSYEPENVVQLPEGPQWIQIDLESEHEIHVILFWQFFESKRVYFDVVVQASNDPEFEEDVTTLFNNDEDNTLGFGEGEDPEFVTTHQGKLVDVEGIEARYVRLWSNGNSWNRRNHWIEVEVYATPVEAE
ncbi:MAG: discoidin domain-containing protein [Candidatus Hydrogenedentota bacterium]